MHRNRAWNHNVHYHDLILHLVGHHGDRALDVGCGQGLLARLLAERFDEVVAIDPDRQSLADARALGEDQPRIEYVEGDVMSYAFDGESFDCITAVASLHHLPLEPALVRFRDLLKPGGFLVVIGLYRESGIADYVNAAIALPISRILRIVNGYSELGAPIAPPKETLREIREASGRLLPGSFLKRRLLFRYSLVWRSPAQQLVQP
jgi:2-polyprenyl-3-methyl-5-hydroxy-6-metoxy-1,4-benzoquinol methylase